MYHKINNKMYYNEANPVMCPYTRKQCMLTCPLVKQELARENSMEGEKPKYCFYCGSHIQMYDVEDIGVQAFIEIGLIAKIIKYFKNWGI